MRALSLDLRERIVTAYENGEGSHAVLARRFAVSKAWVGKLVRQKCQLRTLEPQVHRRGRKCVIQGEKLAELREHVARYPDATLEERIEALKLNCCVNTMWTTLRRLGLRFKKNFPRGRAESSGRRSTAARLAHVSGASGP